MAFGYKYKIARVQKLSKNADAYGDTRLDPTCASKHAINFERNRTANHI